MASAWARHWLDVARYAESSGFEGDGFRPNVWRYRDYVINAFNQDKPFDRFLTEQLAGDEIDGASAESKIALTFLRLGAYDGNAGDKELHRYDQFDDVLSTVAQAFLGQTLGCARCHEHKFEPFPQRDYYRFLAVFRPLMSAGENNGVPVGSDREVEEHKQKLAALKVEQDALQRKLDEQKAAILERLGNNQPVPKPKVYSEEVLTALRAESAPAPRTDCWPRCKRRSTRRPGGPRTRRRRSCNRFSSAWSRSPGRSRPRCSWPTFGWRNPAPSQPCAS